ncbi:MAG: alkaline phosphatase family protein [Dehalococcoidia bacterium]
MSAPGLIVFVDGLGAEAAEERRLFRSLPDHRAVVPGLGYSVNIQAELFAGTTPDDAGFFCHWQYAPQGSRAAAVRPLLEAWSALVPAHSWLDVQAHRALARGLGMDALRIPLRELAWLRRTGDYHTVTGDCDLFRSAHLVSWARAERPVGRRDAVVFEQALALLRRRVERPVVATLVDFDAVGHDPGPRTPPFEAAAQQLDVRVSRLVEALDAYAPDAPVVVLSDHGQTAVRDALDLALDRTLGRPAPGRWVSFIDSTVARVWSPDPALLGRAREALEAHAHVLSEDERRRFGVTSRRFGDLITVAPEGAVFRPSHVSGRSISPGMHGYHPDTPSQWAAWASRGVPVPDTPRLSTLEAHGALTSRFVA